MPTTKKNVKASRVHRCDFCRSKINVGDLMVKCTIKDNFGKYRLTFHVECDRTHELNQLNEWS